MLEIYQRLNSESVESVDGQLTLDHLQREKGRFKAESSCGEEVRVFLERGHTLAIGEVLRSNCGKNLSVIGAVETVTYATSEDWGQFSKACYHLGNRHIKIQIGDRWLRITPDHVLEEMLQQLGLTTRSEQAVFVPEPGAYVQRGGHGHHHH
jgi:urease accessory protein